MNKEQPLNLEEFKFRVEQEGLEYTVCNFYSREALESIEDEEIRTLCLTVADATEKVMQKLDLW